MVQSQLPEELIRLILQFISDDERSDPSFKAQNLLSVCLSSRTFCHLAGPQLYGKIILPDSRRAKLFLTSSRATFNIYMKYLWCGLVGELLYEAPHGILQMTNLPAKEVAWMQADSDGRYYGFHYSAQKMPIVSIIHIICPDFGRWTRPLFEMISKVQNITITLYPKGNWDMEENKIFQALQSILDVCLHLNSLIIILGHTVSGAGSRLVRMNRSIPIARAVRAIDDDRICVKTSQHLFGSHGRLATEEVIQCTFTSWKDSVEGRISDNQL